MSNVTFFHNERVDGARRTGLSVNGERALEQYTPGDEERDPALRWYVDVVHNTPAPPGTREEAEAWLAAHAGSIRDALADAADRLGAGLDPDDPWTFERPGPDGPVRVSVSAMRSEAGHGIGSAIRRLLGTEWKSFLEPVRAAGGA